MSTYKKILIIFGTRPEAIKMAPLIKEFAKQPDKFLIQVCITGQHRQMLDQVLKIFEIEPDYDLNIMKDGQDLYDVTSRVLLGVKDVLEEARPDLVLVHGDTSTSTAAALAAFYQQIPVGHVEAGLRTHNIYNPWPEEMNRQLTGRLATYHFAPTPLSKQNLLNEGVKEEYIYVTGNTVIDSLYWVIAKMKNDKSLENSITQKLKDFGLPIEKLDSWLAQQNNVIVRNAASKQSLRIPRKLVLITGHRRENFGKGFINICKAIKELAVTFPEVDFVYPMHLNPNVRSAIKQVFGNAVILNPSTDGEESHNIGTKEVRNTYFIEPIDYLLFVFLMNASFLVLTDSGGIQEEAPGLGKPVLVMRNATERPEALEAGTVELVGTDYNKIFQKVSLLLDNDSAYKKMSKAVNPYGDGKACERIISTIINN